MDEQTLIFWIFSVAFSFGILFSLALFLLSLSQKKRIEKKLDDILLEVRDMTLRITILETRVEERAGKPSITYSSGVTKVANKRGRPPKKPPE